MNRSIKILFISAFHTPFIQDDIGILEKHFTVRKRIGYGIRHLVRILFSVAGSDVIFCWFASVYAAVAVLAGKVLGVKSIIMVGGVDIAKNKQLGYGLWLSPWKSWLVRRALHAADRVLISDPSMKERILTLASVRGDNLRYLAPGFDAQVWKPVGVKEPMVLTVAAVSGSLRLKVKGIDLLVEASRRLPQISFVVIGVDEAMAKSLGPGNNVRWYPPMARADLLSHYRRAKVYCQPSREESLSYTLREAMLCGCIPVAAEVGGMPTAVGGVGLLVPPDDVEALAAAIQQAVQMSEEVGARARARIVALFPLEKREQNLVRLVKECSG